VVARSAAITLLSGNDDPAERGGTSGSVSDLSRNLLSKDIETTVTVERDLLLHEFPAFLSLIVKQHLKATLAGGIFVSVVRTSELFDAVLPLSAHTLKGTAA
jgi:hypothetical protein